MTDERAGEGVAPSPAPAGDGGSEARRPRSTAARVLRICAGTVVALLVVAAMLVTGLRIALAYLPEHAGPLRTWAEQQTHMRFEYERLDARLRWYGPEIVLRGMKVLDEDGAQTLFAAREGSIGLDVWNLFRTGQLVAGRVRVDRPRLTLVRLPDGRIRLLGLAERPSERPPFDLDRLPAGRLVVEDATVEFRDLMDGRPSLELRKLDGELRRDRDFVRIEGSAQLPKSLGSSVDFELRLKGSLDAREQLDARAEVRVESLHLAGLADFLPSSVARPLRGQGPVRAVLATQQGRLSHARLEVDLRNVALNTPARAPSTVTDVEITERRTDLESGSFLPHATVTKTLLERPAVTMPRVLEFDVLAGKVRLRREDTGWSLRAENLRVATDGQPGGTPMLVAGSWWGHPASRFGLTLEVERVDLGRLWPLALAFAPSAFDRWAGLAPTGRVAVLRAHATRELAGRPPDFQVDADLQDIAVRPVGRLAGISGLSAKISGNERKGEAHLQATSTAFDWPRFFAEPIHVDRGAAELTWRRDADGWRIETRGARLAEQRMRAALDAELQVFAMSTRSPVLTLDGRVDGIDVATVPRYIPFGKLRERTIAWLERAFVAGSAGNGRVHWQGPVRRFPFRHGEGEFVASVDVQGLTLDYYPGFAPLTNGVAKVDFRNETIHAELQRGDVAGLRLDGARFDLSDYYAPVLYVDARGTADLHAGLDFVQGSPLGPRIGEQFMTLRGNGPARYDVRLVLPVLSEAARARLTGPVPAREYFVRAGLDGVDVTFPALRAPAQRVSGAFELHDGRITIPSLRGTILDGPFELEANPGSLSRDVTAAIDLTARGRAGGSKLPAFIGLPATIRMGGAADWQLAARLEQRGSGRWPMTFDIASDLVGLDIAAPRPFAKAASEARTTHVRLELGDPRANDVNVDSGSARAKLRFVDVGDRWRLDRGTARFDGKPVSFASQPGLLIAGEWPQFDLGEWIALGDPPSRAAAAGSGPRLMDWLGPVDVHLDRATVFGFELDDVVAQLRSSGDSWQVGVSSPRAEGQITVPDDLSRGRPIVLNMKRLLLVSAPASGESKAAVATKSPPTDPRNLPAITVHADEFGWQARRFGRLDAVLTRDPRGLTFESIRTSSPTFEIALRGGWYMDAGTSRTQVEGTLTSTDLGAAASALGYRDAVDARNGLIAANLAWPGGPTGDALKIMNGTLRISLEDGQLRDIEPGAGRMLGLLSVAQLPKRLALDFSDVTDQGLAFNSVHGDFDIRSGDAFTNNLLLKGPAVTVGVVGRTGLAREDYDQTVVVSGNTSGPLAVAGALAAGPVVGASVLLLSQLFKDQLQGLARVYYHVGGPWSAPVVERISASAAETVPAATTPPAVPARPPASTTTESQS